MRSFADDSLMMVKKRKLKCLSEVLICSKDDPTGHNEEKNKRRQTKEAVG